MKEPKNAVKNHLRTPLQNKDSGIAKVLLVSTVLVLAIGTVSAAITSFKSPSRAGDNYDQFSSPTNLFASDNNDASEDRNGRRQDVYDFNFGIPEGSKINGIEVVVEGQDPTYASQGVITELSWDGGASYTSTGHSATYPGANDANESMGGLNDTWGRSWSASELSNTNFRVRLEKTGADYNNMNYDSVRVRVNYTEPAPPIWRNPSSNVSEVIAGEAVNLSVEFGDTDNGIYKVKLATNQSGTWRNYTSKYGSPEIFSNQTDQFLTADFVWSKDGFNGVLGYRMWGQDAAGLWNRTDTGTIEVNDGRVEVSSKNPDDGINVAAPVNFTFNTQCFISSCANASLYLNSTAGNTESVWQSVNKTSKVQNNSLNSLDYDFADYNLPETFKWGIKVVNTDDIKNFTENRTIKVFSKDRNPRWRNLSQEKDIVDPTEQNTLRAQGLDQINLSHAILATNESGTLQNITGNYSSPMKIGRANKWTWTNFTWKNDSFRGDTLKWQIWYNDTAGNYNSTDIKTFKVRSQDLSPPAITIKSPENKSIPNSDIWLNVSADETVEEWKYNLDNSGNTTFDGDVLLSSLSEGAHKVTVWANDTAGNIANKTRYFTVDVTPPKYRNQQQEKDVINQSEENELSVELFDDIGLDRAILQTNQTGQLENSSRYGLPIDFNGADSWQWANFTWTDSFFSGVVKWRVWFEDQAGNVNVTKSRKFEVKEKNLRPLFRNADKNTSELVDKGDSINLSVEVKDTSPGLKRTKIANNETGIWQNYTSAYGSPQVFTTPGQKPVATAKEFRKGSFTRTSVSRNSNSGNLGISYSNGTSDQNILGYWRLDQAVSGTDGSVTDYSGNGHSGTTNGGIQTGAQGILSTNSYSFDGTDDVVTVPESDALEPKNQITLSAWVKRNGSQVSYAKPVWYGPNNDAPYGPYGFEHAADNDTGIQFHIAYSSSSYSKIGPAYIPNQEWVHLVGTYDGSTQRLYKNGELVASASVSGTISDYDDSNGLGIGDKYATGQPFKGSVDEVRIINESYTQTEVKQLYFNGKPFVGQYTGETIVNDNRTIWGPLEVEASIPADTNLSAVVQVLDQNGDVADEQVINISDGLSNYSVSLANRRRARVTFNGTSSNATKTWKVNSFNLHYDEITEQDWTQTEFIWRNSSFTGELGYRIWAEDGTGQWNRTDTRTVSLSDIQYTYDPENTTANVVSNLRIYQGGQLKLDTSADSGAQSVPLLPGEEYKIKQSFSNGEFNTTFLGFNITNSVSPKTQFVNYSNVDQSFTSTYNLSKVYAVNDTSLDYKKAQLRIPKPNATKIFHCTDWDFSKKECNKWEINSTEDYPHRRTDTHLIFNVTGFDAFGAGSGQPQPITRDIRIYDVTGLSQSKQETGGKLVASGLNTTLNISQTDKSREYRFEFKIENNGSSNWNIEGSDELYHSGLNTSWDVGKIWYNLSQQYIGGNFSNGKVNWNTSKKGVLESEESNNTMYAKYLVNITTTESRLYNQEFLVNDTSANSGSQVYHQLNITKYGYLDIALDEPPDSTTVTQDKVFTGNASLTCREGICGNTSITLRYNQSSTADTPIPTTQDTPFYITGTENKKECADNMKSNESCYVTWQVNATGAKKTKHLLDAKASSTASQVYNNDTSDNLVTINEAILISLGFDKISFGVLDPGQEDKPAEGNSRDLYNITVEEGSVTVDNLWVKTSNLTASGWGDYHIPVENISYALQNQVSNEKQLSRNYQSIESNIDPGTNVTTYYWIDTPEGIKSGEYNSTISFKANATR